MLKQIKTYITKTIIFLLAVQILNMSVHSGDYNSNPFLQKGESIGMLNQIDCAAEYLVEHVFSNGDSDLFPDNDLHNSTKRLAKFQQKIAEFTIGTSVYQQVRRPIYYLPLKQKFTIQRNMDLVSLCSIEILSPPPQNKFYC